MATNPDLWFTIFRRELSQKIQSMELVHHRCAAEAPGGFKRLRPWPAQTLEVRTSPFVRGTLPGVCFKWPFQGWFLWSSIWVINSGHLEEAGFFHLFDDFIDLVPYRLPNALWGGMTTRGPQKTPPSSGGSLVEGYQVIFHSWPPKESSNLERVKFSPSQRGQNELTGTITYFSLRIFVPFWDGKSHH